MAGSTEANAVILHRQGRATAHVHDRSKVAGGPELWGEFRAELRTVHLGAPAPERTGPSATDRLAKAYAGAR